MNDVFVDFPMTYHARILPPRKRTERTDRVTEMVSVRMRRFDLGDVDLQEIELAARRFTCCDIEGRRYFPISFTNQIAPEGLGLSELRRITAEFGSPDVQRRLRSVRTEDFDACAFLSGNEWEGPGSYAMRRVGRLAGSIGRTIEDIAPREVLSTNRDEMIDRTHSWAEGYVVVEDKLFTRHLDLGLRVGVSRGPGSVGIYGHQRIDKRFWRRPDREPKHFSDTSIYVTGMDRPGFGTPGVPGTKGPSGSDFPDLHASLAGMLPECISLMGRLSLSVPGVMDVHRLALDLQRKEAEDIPAHRIAETLSDLYLGLCESMEHAQDNDHSPLMRGLARFVAFWTSQDALPRTTASDWIREHMRFQERGGASMTR